MKTHPIHSLATLDSGCGDIRLLFDNLELVLQYEFRAQDTDQIGRIRFVGVIAFRFTDELHSAGFAEGSYDEVVQVQPSEWMGALEEVEPAGFSGLSSKSHFAVLLSSNGYLEVVADRVDPGQPTLGLLER